MFSQYRHLLKDRFEDGDIYYAKTLILLKDWPLEEVSEAIEKCIELGILGDRYILALLRKKLEPVESEEHVSVRIELTKYKARQRPLKDYDIILRLKKGENKNEQEKSDNAVFKRR